MTLDIYFFLIFLPHLKEPTLQMVRRMFPLFINYDTPSLTGWLASPSAQNIKSLNRSEKKLSVIKRVNKIPTIVSVEHGNFSSTESIGEIEVLEICSNPHAVLMTITLGNSYNWTGAIMTKGDYFLLLLSNDTYLLLLLHFSLFLPLFFFSSNAWKTQHVIGPLPKRNLNQVLSGIENLNCKELHFAFLTQLSANN